MNAESLAEFDRAVTVHFKPLAEGLGSNLGHPAKGMYEIVSGSFTLRVRLGTGHGIDILVTAVPTSSKSVDPSELQGEIGLGVITEFYGAKLETVRSNSREKIEPEVAKLSALSSKFISPFLIGKNTDWERIKAFVENKIADSGIRSKQYNFPKNVRKEWEI